MTGGVLRRASPALHSSVLSLSLFVETIKSRMRKGSLTSPPSGFRRSPTGAQRRVGFDAQRPVPQGGHFLCLRSLGLPAEEFAIGFGPEAGRSRSVKRADRGGYLW